jgi:hypothetical protein
VSESECRSLEGVGPNRLPRRIHRYDTAHAAGWPKQLPCRQHQFVAYHSPLSVFLRRRIGGTPIATGSATNRGSNPGGGMVLPTDGIDSNL